MNDRGTTIPFACLSAAAAILITVLPPLPIAAQSPNESPAATQPDRTKRIRSTASASNSNVPPSDPTLLAGPKVEEDAELREAPRLRQLDSLRGPNDEIPFGVWVSALRGLGLSSQQQASIRQVAREFEDKARTFRDSQPADVRQLMRETRQAREQGMPPPPEAREKLARIEADMPRPKPYQERIWAMLTKDQQEQMKTTLDEMRSEMGRRAIPREAASPTDMTEPPADQPMNAQESRPANHRPRANGKAWRFWLLDPFPMEPPTEPAATQPSQVAEPMMTGQP